MDRGISRQKSCGTASGSGSQNWGAKKEVFLESKLTNLNVQKGLGELAMSHLVPLSEFNHIQRFKRLVIGVQ